jgi:hypothetical protein
MCLHYRQTLITTDLDKIQELNSWYNIWWNYAAELERKIFTNLDEQVKKITHTRNDIDYIYSQKFIKTYYDQINIKNRINKQKDEEYLINFLKHWNNQSFTEYFFDLAQYVIEKYNIKENDERLCITFREEKYKIPITIGQRYILAPYWLTESIGLIMPLNYNKKNANLDGFYKEEFYKLKQKDSACWVYYKKEKKIEFNETTLMEWENAIKNELLRSKRSSYRKYHQVILYKFIVEKDFRIKIMREIY